MPSLRRRRRRRATKWSSHPQRVILQRLQKKVLLFCRRFKSGKEDGDCNSVYVNDGVYGQKHVLARTVPLTIDNVAIPGEGGKKVKLVDLLPEAIIEELRHVRHLDDNSNPRRGEEEVGSVDYAALLFGVAPGQYEPLVFLLQKHGIVELVATPGEAVQGVFGVPKGDLARLILNAVPANLLCKVPPDPGLPLLGKTCREWW